MRILILLPSVVDVTPEGVFNNTVANLIPRYKHIGDELNVIVYSKKCEKSTASKIEIANCKLIYRYKVNSLKTYIKYDKINRSIVRDCISNADACVFHIPNADDYFIVNEARRQKKPYIIFVCGCAWDGYWNYGLKGKLVAPFKFFVMRHVVKKALYCVYVSDWFLQNRYSTNGNSISCSNVSIKTSTDAIEKRIMKIENMSLHKIKLGTLAALDVPYKGQDIVIKALSLLKKRGVFCEYHLAGHGDYGRLQRIARQYGVVDQVHFHGMIAHSDVVMFLDDIDLYIQPSKTEGLPRALIEAMSRGCPALGSRAASIPELLEEKYIFKKGNYNHIARTIKELDIDTLKQQAERNFHFAKRYEKTILDARRNEFMERFIDNSKI